MIRLAKLPDRTPVRITIVVPPNLHQALQQYGDLYLEAYGETQPVSELNPALLGAFLASDRAFWKGPRRPRRARTMTSTDMPAAAAGSRPALEPPSVSNVHRSSPFYSNGEAAAFLNLSPRTLEKMRVVGRGGGTVSQIWSKGVLYLAGSRGMGGPAQMRLNVRSVVEAAVGAGMIAPLSRLEICRVSTYSVGRRRFLASMCASRHAGVVKLVDAPDSKSGSERSVGSSPTARTITIYS